ncbi:MAG: TrmH family RNA methyltransferase [Planctomycetota bacterium]
MPEPTRCPNPACRAVFLVEARLLGRTTSCPRCGGSMTARPLAILEKLDERERQLRAGDPSEIERLNRSQRLAAKEQARACWHPPLEGDPNAGLAHDPMYEGGVDRERSDGLLPPCDLVAILDDVRSQWNVGAIFRTADGAGWRGLSLAGITPVPPNRIVAKVALGAEGYVPWRYHASVVEAALERQREGYELVALEQTKDAVPIFELEPARKTALLLGNEVVGASAEALSLCKRRVTIPMAGRKASLNVAVAFGVAAFLMARAWRRMHGDATL